MVSFLAVRVAHTHTIIYFSPIPSRSSHLSQIINMSSVLTLNHEHHIEICDFVELREGERNHNNKLSKVHLIMLADENKQTHTHGYGYALIRHFIQLTQLSSNNNVLIKF